MVSAAVALMNSGAVEQTDPAAPTAPAAATPAATAAPTDADAEASEAPLRSAPLAEGGRITVQNLNAKILIKSWDRPEVKVESADNGQTPEGMNDGTLDFKADQNRVTIKTRAPAARAGRKDGDADYTILIPRKARLDKITNIDGTIEIEGVEGEIKASTINGALIARKVGGAGSYKTVNGRLEVALAKWAGEKGLSLDSVNGKVTLLLPAKINANIKADTLNGTIETDTDLPVQNRTPVGRGLEGSLGEGGPVIKLHSVNGPLVINQAAAGVAKANVEK